MLGCGLMECWCPGKCELRAEKVVSVHRTKRNPVASRIGTQPTWIATLVLKLMVNDGKQCRLNWVLVQARGGMRRTGGGQPMHPCSSCKWIPTKTRFFFKSKIAILLFLGLFDTKDKT